ncbi:MAG: hypothetical protein BMS9Abin13_526 [Patescibacteria group bacterium]|nr:MAG: hypothetical protein BMS9Abin13_526 [Patescibacteria group bacterium]
MKKFLRIVQYGIVSISIFLPFLAAGQTRKGGGVSGGATLENPLVSIGSFGDFVAAILGIVVKIGVPIAAIFIIYSGFLFVTAGGSEEKLTKAKTSFLWAVVGTGILLGAWVLAQAIGTTIESLR